MVIGHLAVKLRTAVAVSASLGVRLGLQTWPGWQPPHKVWSCVEFAMSGSGQWPSALPSPVYTWMSLTKQSRLLLRMLSAKCLRPLHFTLVCSLASQASRPRCCTLHEGHPLKTVLWFLCSSRGLHLSWRQGPCTQNQLGLKPHFPHECFLRNSHK